jgi:hypothetical protein
MTILSLLFLFDFHQFQTPEQFFRDSRSTYDCDRSVVDLGFSLEKYLRQVSLIISHSSNFL